MTIKIVQNSSKNKCVIETFYSIFEVEFIEQLIIRWVKNSSLQLPHLKLDLIV